MILNFPMFHQNIFIIYVLIPIFIYFGKKQWKKSYLFQCKLYLILKARAQYQILFKLGQICSNLLLDVFSIRYLLEHFDT